MKKELPPLLVPGILLLLCVLAVLGNWIIRLDKPASVPFMEELYFAKNPAIDCIEVYEFGYQGCVLLGETTDPELIGRYVSAHRWEDTYAICCDEATAYVFEEYANGWSVGDSKLPRGKTRYNNRKFAAVQKEILGTLLEDEIP